MRKRNTLVLTVLILSMILTSCVNENKGSKSQISLYPAYKKDQNKKLWGYIDANGDFKIEPKFQFAENFDENGLAKVYNEGKMGLINENCEIVVPPIYDAISNLNEDVMSAVQDNKYFILDKSGNILFSSSDYLFLGISSEGYISAAKKVDDDVKMGYIDKNGKELIKPQFNIAYDFKNGRALVKNADDKYALIDNTGKIIKELNYENVSPADDNKTFIFTDENNLYGYLDENGDVFIKPKFTNAYHYEDKMAIVSIEDTSKNIGKWGVIDKKGEYLIKPKYTSIVYLGEGLFAVSKDEIEGSEMYVKKAIVNQDDKQLTEFEYYNIGGNKDKKIDNGYISVSDGKHTFLLDKKGKQISKFPKIEGVGEVSLKGDVIASVIDDRIAYYNLKGKAIWEEDNTYKLRGEAVVVEKKHVPDIGVKIYYPEIQGLKDRKVEKTINEKLYNLFVTDTMKGLKENKEKTTLNLQYSVRRSNDLLIIQKSGYYFMQGAAHGVPTEETYHIDLYTGKFYSLKDLFKPNSNYVEKLTDIVKKQMKKSQSEGTGTYFLDDFKSIREDQNFVLFKDYIQLYFYPYEVASYAEGFANLVFLMKR
ncbi:MAG: WG containing repeat-containing protein [Sporanaerobacter sp.]|uniref:WG repeat-containing protein n=1 Tax=Sporanaerobacter sp. TaxID=2010183 RepID=UPI003A102938